MFERALKAQNTKFGIAEDQHFNEKNKIQTQLCDQELLKTEIRKLKAELIQNNKKSLEETEYLKALIDKYKFTMKLYKKELDYKEDLTYEQS